MTSLYQWDLGIEDADNAGPFARLRRQLQPEPAPEPQYEAAATAEPFYGTPEPMPAPQPDVVQPDPPMFNQPQTYNAPEAFAPREGGSALGPLGGIWGGIQDVASAITPNYIENPQPGPLTMDYGRATEPLLPGVQETAGDIGALAGRAAEFGIPQLPFGLPSWEDIGRFGGESAIDTSPTGLGLSPLIGFVPGVDDLARGIARAPGRLFPAGDEIIEEGAEALARNVPGGAAGIPSPAPGARAAPPPEALSDLERSLQLSTQGLEADPALARQAFAAQGQQVGADIGARQNAITTQIQAERRAARAAAQQQAPGAATPGEPPTLLEPSTGGDLATPAAAPAPTGSIFHEGNTNDLFDVLPNSGRIGAGSKEWWYTRDPGLAIGQGNRQGVLLEFDEAAAGPLRARRSKPAAGFTGDELYNDLAPPPQSLKSVTVKPDAQMENWERTRLQGYMERNRWDTVTNPDDSVTYMAPAAAPGGAPGQVQQPGAPPSPPPAVSQGPGRGAPPPPIEPPRGLTGDAGGIPPNQGARQPSLDIDWNPGTPLWRQVARAAGDVLTVLPRALQTGFDYSYPLRQGALIGARHEKEFWSNFDKGFRSLFSEGFARARQAQIEQAPFNPRTLELTDWGPGTKFIDREEDFMSRLSDFIPGIKQSQRAATVFINGLRSDVANTFARNQLRHMDATDPRFIDNLDRYGSYVSRATGRGNLGAFENSVGALNQVFYSARRNVAMAQVPGYLFNSSATIRKEAFLDFVTFLGMGAGTLKLADLAGADVGLKPGDADFGKIRVGNTRVDIWGGYQQMARLVYNIANGQYKNPGDIEGFGKIVAGYLGNKLSPQAGIAVSSGALGEDVRKGLQPIDRPLNLGNLSPLAWQGIVDAIKEDGLTGGAMAATGLLGTGVQTYVKPADRYNDPIQQALRGGQTYTNAQGQQVPYPAQYEDADGNLKPIKTITDLRAADPLAAEAIRQANPQVREKELQGQSEASRRIQELKDENLRVQAEDRDPLLASDPAAWRRASGEASRDLAIAVQERAQDFEGTPEQKTALNEALQTYGKALDANKTARGIDWEGVDRELANLSKRQQDLIFANGLVGETEPRREYLRALQTPEMRGYFDVRDKAWAELSKGDSELQQYKSLDEFRQALTGELHEAGLGWSEAKTRVDSKLDPWIDRVGKETRAYIAENAEELLPALDKYDFYIPAALRKYVRH